jgi:hypothetical protein
MTLVTIKVPKEATYRMLLRLLEDIRYNHLYEDLTEMKKLTEPLEKVKVIKK